MTFDTGESRLESEARALVERLGGHWSGQGGMCRCPAHDDRRPSLSVRLGRSRLLLHCFAGCSARDILRSAAILGFVRRDTAPLEEERPGGTGRLSAAALRLWGSGRPIAGSLAELYLSARGLEGSPELRFHPRAPHGPRPLTRLRPALVAAVRDESGIVAVHRTFFDPVAKPVAAVAKCALGPLGRGSVRLGGTAPRLGLAEGIETALSASTLFGIPCWATLGAERFRGIALPPEVNELVLFLDNDPGGRRAEGQAREAHGHRAAIEARYPRRKGYDWNDVLRLGAARERTVAAPD